VCRDCTPGLKASRHVFATELTEQKNELLATLDELSSLLTTASPAQRDALWELCAAIDAQAQCLAAEPGCKVAGFARLLVAEVLSSRERLFLLKQALRTLAARPALPPIASTHVRFQASPHKHGSSVSHIVAASDDPIAGAAAALGLDVASSTLGTRKRQKLSREGKLVLMNWLRSHLTNPYPDDDAKRGLAHATETSVEYIRWVCGAMALTTHGITLHKPTS
jgi:hypothetical protein